MLEKDIVYFPDSSSQWDLCYHILPLTLTHAEQNGCHNAITLSFAQTNKILERTDSVL